jgi:hypothetical protein
MFYLLIWRSIESGLVCKVCLKPRGENTALVVSYTDRRATVNSSGYVAIWLSVVSYNAESRPDMNIAIVRSSAVQNVETKIYLKPNSD